MRMKQRQENFFGENLERIRKQKGITRKQIADCVNVTELTVGKYSRGENMPPLDKVFKIAKFLNVPMADLIGENQDYVNQKIFEYRLQKAWQLTEFLEPTFNYNGISGSDKPKYDEQGRVIVYSAEKLKYENGVITEGEGFNALVFSENNFVKVMEQAEHNALYRQTTLNQEFRKIVFNE